MEQTHVLEPAGMQQLVQQIVQQLPASVGQEDASDDSTSQAVSEQIASQAAALASARQAMQLMTQLLEASTAASLISTSAVQTANEGENLPVTHERGTITGGPGQGQALRQHQVSQLVDVHALLRSGIFQ